MPNPKRYATILSVTFGLFAIELAFSLVPNATLNFLPKVLRRVSFHNNGSMALSRR